MNIKELYSEYINLRIEDLTTNQRKRIKDTLNTYKSEDLKTVEEHKMFIELLKIFRTAGIRSMELEGEGFISTLRSTLAVGEDGLYSNKHRFFYELIQNVDDCDYEDISNCQLEIQFKDYTEQGEIIFTYNEKGFTPQNVIGITGIAEQIKNVTVDKIEIGEKGIGFKSVFGIADKVLIESGYFSFELYRDNFTIPIPYYKKMNYTKGTRLTLKMPAQSVKSIYREMVFQYTQNHAALNKNPILFLNKLTQLKMYYEGIGYIEFNVQRKFPEMIGNLVFENDVIVSVDIKDNYNGKEQKYNTIIKCKRYTKSITYEKEECRSRYGNNTVFTKKKHNLIALFPDLSEVLKGYKGLLYSFLPTQIYTSVPILLHVPFKLDGSREFVDPQGRNQWFLFTVKELNSFLKDVYIHLATIIKEDVIQYIPNKFEFFFQNTNEKIQCLLQDSLKGEIIYTEKVFYTTSNTYESADKILSFSRTENIPKPLEIFRLLEPSKKLFIPKSSIDMSKYGVEILSNIPELLFKKAFTSNKNFSETLNVLAELKKELNYVELLKEIIPIQLTKEQILIISNHKKIHKEIVRYGNECIRKAGLPQITFTGELLLGDNGLSPEIRESVQSSNLEEVVVYYLNKINFKIYEIQGIIGEFFIVGQNGMVVSKDFSTESFISFVEKYDRMKLFTSSLRINQASNRLNKVDNTMKQTEYFKLLQEVRKSIRSVLGDDKYLNYIQLINESGIDPNRFLNEILQNADDCEYPEGEIPEFELKINNNQIIITYNELGFTNSNVRAITAIGESTKKLLLNNERELIGKKGVGFKSVFSVAQSVEIHSNGFDFILTDENPTIPEKCEPLIGTAKGTTLIFNMKTDIAGAINEDEILKLCLCLRKLGKIKIQNIAMDISDINNKRVIEINNKIYNFKTVSHNFKVRTEIFKEHFPKSKSVNENQTIRCYIPQNNNMEQYPLYVGLPTQVTCNVPLVIDAPFELTTARENVIQNNWNDMVKMHVYETILQIMNLEKQERKINIFELIKINTRTYGFELNEFSEQYLNDFDIKEDLRKMTLIPTLNSSQFVSIENECCNIVPDIIASMYNSYSSETSILKKIGVKGVIINTGKTFKFNTLLVRLGCKQITITQSLELIERKIKSKTFSMNLLYKYLLLPSTQQEIKEQGYYTEVLYSKIKALPIFPVRFTNGVIKYVPYSKKIFTHRNKKSDKVFL